MSNFKTHLSSSFVLFYCKLSFKCRSNSTLIFLLALKCEQKKSNLKQSHLKNGSIMIKLNKIAVWVSSFVVKVIYIKNNMSFKVKVHGKLEYILINTIF